MKKWIYLSLCVVLCISLCACGGKTTDSTEKGNAPVIDTPLPESEAIAIAKQQVVNLCCDETAVRQISLTSFNVINTDYHNLGEPHSYWEIEVRGLFFPVDSYGDHRNRHKFDATIKVFNSRLTAKEEFSCYRG